jgi:5,10-methenyltetrahydromethanopterin hydrogenase
MGFTHDEVATLLGKPSANAARMAVERALVRLAAEMRSLGINQAAPEPDPTAADSSCLTRSASASA